MGFDTIVAALVQGGFAAFCGVLLVLLAWTIRRLLDELKRANEVIARNTEAFVQNTQAVQDLTTMSKDLLSLQRKTHDRLISRPCLLERD